MADSHESKTTLTGIDKDYLDKKTKPGRQISTFLQSLWQCGIPSYPMKTWPSQHKGTLVWPHNSAGSSGAMAQEHQPIPVELKDLKTSVSHSPLCQLCDS